MSTMYPFDPTGTLSSNRVTSEQHIITAISGRNYHLIVPDYAPFFADNCIITHQDIDGGTRILQEGIDFHFGFQFIAASRSCAKPIYGAISFLNLQLSGLIRLSYQTVGGNWTLAPIKINEILSDILRNPRVISWEQVTGVPTLFPVVDHDWDLQDLVGMSDVKEAIDNVTTAIGSISTPPQPIDNKPVVSKYTIGLGNVQNLGVATDQEAIAGTSITKNITPRGVRLAIEHANTALLNEIDAVVDTRIQNLIDQNKKINRPKFYFFSLLGRNG